MCGNCFSKVVAGFYEPIKAIQNSLFTSENCQETGILLGLNFWDFGKRLGVGGRILSSKTLNIRQTGMLSVSYDSFRI